VVLAARYGMVSGLRGRVRAGPSAGRYQVEFTAGCGDARYATRWYRGATSRSGARPVIVSAGSVTTGIDQG
jgi:hypothetical protein